MSEKECPLCGKLQDDDSNVCWECQKLAENRNKTDFAETDNHEEQQQQETTDNTIVLSTDQQEIPIVSKKKKRKKVILFLSVLITILVMGIGLYYTKVSKEKNAENAELQYWYACIEKNTPLEYSKYLLRYPNGKFQQDAHDKIVSLRKNEYDSWVELQKSNDLDEYYSYLSNNPNTPYITDIRNKMDSLAWNIAQIENSADAYKAYLENIELGNLTGYYTAIAQERYDYLSQIKNVEGDELKEILELTKSFFKALSSPKQENLVSMFAPKVSSFYGATNVTKESIIKSIEKDKASKGVKNIIYTLQPDSIDVQKDNKGIYLIDLVVNKKIIYKANTEILNETIQVNLSPDKQIISLSLKNE